MHDSAVVSANYISGVYVQHGNEHKGKDILRSLQELRHKVKNCKLSLCIIC